LVRDARGSLEELTAQQRENIAFLGKLTSTNARCAPHWVFSGRTTFLAERWLPLEISERQRPSGNSIAQPGDDPKIAVLKAMHKSHEAGNWPRRRACRGCGDGADVPDRLAVNAAEMSARR
jgi:hypothetical protein